LCALHTRLHESINPRTLTCASVHGVQFSVEFEKRAAAPTLDRMEIINTFAREVPAPPNTVNLGDPAKSIMVNLVKGTCGVAVVDDFRKLAKYNIKAIVAPPEEKEAEKEGAEEPVAAEAEAKAD
jgi:hypothetical protein